MPLPPTTLPLRFKPSSFDISTGEGEPDPTNGLYYLIYAPCLRCGAKAFRFCSQCRAEKPGWSVPFKKWIHPGTAHNPHLMNFPYVPRP